MIIRIGQLISQCSRQHSLGRRALPAMRAASGSESSKLTTPSDAASTSKLQLQEYRFEVLSEQQIHRRFLTLYNRRIRFPPGKDGEEKVHDYDIVGHPQADFHFTVVFPFHRNPSIPGGGHVTLLREHCQGPNQMMFVLPTGCVNPQRHATRLACAEAELSEEAHLRGGEWHRLIEEGHPGLAEVKWCANRFTPFMCVDPQEDEQPGIRDAEEFIEIHRVTVEQLRNIMVSGDMMLPSVTTCYLALDRLRDLLPHSNSV